MDKNLDSGYRVAELLMTNESVVHLYPFTNQSFLRHPYNCQQLDVTHIISEGVTITGS